MKKLSNQKIKNIIRKIDENNYLYWILGRSQGDLVIVRAWPCRECGSFAFLTAPCFRNPADEYAHMSILYCAKCGTGWDDTATFHISKDEFQSLPEYTI
ncbi:MAG: hypothetical protein QXM39_04290 [Thermoplasmata archaeon]